MTDAALKDVPYTWGFYREMNPAFLNYLCILGGYEAPEIDAEFTFCELGCGNGVTLNTHAQVFPNGQFIGVDLSPDHIDNARAVAEEAGLGNVTYIAADIESLDSEDCPPLDYIALHGVYSWIDADTRAAILALIQARLKPGGVAYVSYNALPGWSAISPLRRLIQQHTADIDADTIEKARTGLRYLQNLREKEIGYFVDNSPAESFLDEIAEQDIEYVAHEFMADNAAPFYFADVATEMNNLGLQFAANADLHLNFIDLAAAPEHHKFLLNAGTRNDFETMGDFIRNQRFRKDVYVKEPNMLSEEMQQERLLVIPFGTDCSGPAFPESIGFHGVNLAFKSDIFASLIDVLAGNAQSLGRLLDSEPFTSLGPDLLVDAIKFLTASRHMLPFAHSTTAPDADAVNANRFMLAADVNLAMLKRQLFNARQVTVAAPLAGIGLDIPMSDALFLICCVEAPAAKVTEWAESRMAEADKRIAEEGGDETAAVATALEGFRADRLSKFLEIGVIAPAPP